MIAFIDESYHNDEDGSVLVVVGGIVIDEYRYRALETSLYVSKIELARHIYSPDGLSEADLLQRARDIEIKGANCLKPQYLRSDSDNQKPRAALNALLAAEECRARFVLATTRVDRVSKIHGEDERLPEHYVQLLSQVASIATNPNRPVLLAFDSVHGKIDRGLSRRVSDYLYRHADADATRHFVPVPFCIPSDTTAGSQVADVVCRVELLRQLGNLRVLSGIREHLEVLERRRAG